MDDFLVVLSTCGDSGEAQRIAQAIVRERLAACVQIIPGVSSVYRWQERIETATEHLLVIKSSRANFDALQAKIKEMHSYQVPEILALPVAAGSASYLGWLTGELRG